MRCKDQCDSSRSAAKLASYVHESLRDAVQRRRIAQRSREPQISVAAVC